LAVWGRLVHHDIIRKGARVDNAVRVYKRRLVVVLEVVHKGARVLGVTEPTHNHVSHSSHKTHESYALRVEEGAVPVPLPLGKLPDMAVACVVLRAAHAHRAVHVLAVSILNTCKQKKYKRKVIKRTRTSLPATNCPVYDSWSVCQNMAP
jgi:hypothetical protein